MLTVDDDEMLTENYDEGGGILCSDSYELCRQIKSFMDHLKQLVAQPGSFPNIHDLIQYIIHNHPIIIVLADKDGPAHKFNQAHPVTTKRNDPVGKSHPSSTSHASKNQDDDKKLTQNNKNVARTPTVIPGPGFNNSDARKAHEFLSNQHNTNPGLSDVVPRIGVRSHMYKRGKHTTNSEVVVMFGFHAGLLVNEMKYNIEQLQEDTKTVSVREHDIKTHDILQLKNILNTLVSNGTIYKSEYMIILKLLQNNPLEDDTIETYIRDNTTHDDNTQRIRIHTLMNDIKHQLKADNFIVNNIDMVIGILPPIPQETSTSSGRTQTRSQTRSSDGTSKSKKTKSKQRGGVLNKFKRFTHKYKGFMVRHKLRGFTHKYKVRHKVLYKTPIFQKGSAKRGRDEDDNFINTFIHNNVLLFPYAVEGVVGISNITRDIYDSIIVKTILQSGYGLDTTKILYHTLEYLTSHSVIPGRPNNVQDTSKMVLGDTDTGNSEAFHALNTQIMTQLTGLPIIPLIHDVLYSGTLNDDSSKESWLAYANKLSEQVGEEYLDQYVDPTRSIRLLHSDLDPTNLSKMNDIIKLYNDNMLVSPYKNDPSDSLEGIRLSDFLFSVGTTFPNIKLNIIDHGCKVIANEVLGPEDRQEFFEQRASQIDEGVRKALGLGVIPEKPIIIQRNPKTFYQNLYNTVAGMFRDIPENTRGWIGTYPPVYGELGYLTMETNPPLSTEEYRRLG